MKQLIFFILILSSIEINAQDTLGELQAPEKDLEGKLMMGVGFNMPFYLDNKILNHPYDLGQKSNTLGVNIHLGGALQIKNRFGLELTAGFQVFSFRRKYFEKNFQSRIGDYVFYGDEGQDLTNSGGHGMSTNYFHPKIYFIVNPKANNKFVPLAGVQFSRFFASAFSYTLREPSTNYFTTYSIKQNEWERQPLISLGAEFRRTFATMTPKGQLMNSHAALRLMFFYGKYETAYDITIRENNSVEYTIQENQTHTLFFTTLELSFSLFATH